MKVTTKKSNFDRFEESVRHDETIAMMAAQKNASTSEIYRLHTRTTNSYAWFWLLSGLGLGICGIATGGDVGFGILLICLGALAIPVIIVRKKRMQKLQISDAQEQQKHQSAKALTSKEERAKLKEEVRREMLKEELRKEIEAEKRK